jgi:hypothetical protein
MADTTVNPAGTTLLQIDDEAPRSTQKTSERAEIPIPTRDAFLRDLKKVAPPVPERPAKRDDESSA